MRNVSRCRCSARTADHAIARSGCAFGRAVQDLRQMLPGTDVTEEVQEALKGIPLPLRWGVRSINHDRGCDRRDGWVGLSVRT